LIIELGSGSNDSRPDDHRESFRSHRSREAVRGVVAAPRQKAVKTLPFKCFVDFVTSSAREFHIDRDEHEEGKESNAHKGRWLRASRGKKVAPQLGLIAVVVLEQRVDLINEFSRPLN
jgi:hypothetical protein